MTFSLNKSFLEKQKAFADKTWPNQSIEGILKHLTKEVIEIEENPSDITEWVDGILLLTGGAMRAGHDPQDLLDAIQEKFLKNTQREWPKPSEQNPNEASEHLEVMEKEELLITFTLECNKCEFFWKEEICETSINGYIVTCPACNASDILQYILDQKD